MAHKQSPPSGLIIRGGRDSDSEQLIALIESVYAEYPGCVLDVDGEAPHLRHPASAFAGWNGTLWVAELNGRVAGCVGFADHEEAVEAKHLYVASAPVARGWAAVSPGWSRRLLERAGDCGSSSGPIRGSPLRTVCMSGLATCGGRGPASSAI